MKRLRLLWTEISRDREISWKKSEMFCESHWEENVSLADGNKWQPFKQGLKKVPSSGLAQVDFYAGHVTLKVDRKVPKVMRVVTRTFGFSTLLLLLLSEARYFWGIVTFEWHKHVLHMGTSKNKIAKKNEGNTFEKG